MPHLFKDSPDELSKRVDRLTEHFRHAGHVFRETAKGKSRQPTPSELLWILLRDAMHTARAMPDRELRMVKGLGSSMPASRITDSEAYAIELGRRLDTRFSTPYEKNKLRRHTNGEAVDRMVDVLDLLRFVRKEGWQKRRKVAIARASGLSIEQCSRVWDRHRLYDGPRQRSYVVNDAIQRLLSEVRLGIEHEFKLRYTSRGFERIVERQIQKRSQARKRFEDDELREAAE